MLLPKVGVLGWLVCLFLCLLSGEGQTQNVKIGDITLSDSLAKEYFLDCYTHPDTIPSQSYKSGDWYHSRIKNKIGTWDPSLQKPTYTTNAKGDTIGVEIIGSFHFYYIVPREPSALDFMLFMNRVISSGAITSTHTNE